MSRAVAAEVARTLDDHLTGPVLVVGSLPPDGRDLDLLACEREHAVIEDWLACAGFLRRQHSWARIEGDQSYCVDLSSTTRWRSSSFDEARLFDGAEPVPGYRHLLRPSPATMLLLAARGMVTRRGRVTDKIRRRVRCALDRDPDAWAAAEPHARAAGLLADLQLLRRSCEADGALPLTRRVIALALVLHRRGSARATTAAVLELRPRRLRPTVVSFSGLDGAGKSTQVERLQQSLEALGVPVRVQWSGFKTGHRVRRALPLLDRPPGGRRASAPGSTRAELDPLVPACFLRYRALRHAWVFLVVLLNAFSEWRYVLSGHRGKVVIFDRFGADSAVKLDLHFRVARELDIGWQRALLRKLSPRADVGLLIAVPPDLAYTRRQDQAPEELVVMAELYDEQVAPFGLLRLDGTAPVDELSRRVATLVWGALAR